MKAGPAVRFVRVGTLDEPDRLPPNIHIFTKSKTEKGILPGDAEPIRRLQRRAGGWTAGLGAATTGFAIDMAETQIQ